MIAQMISAQRGMQISRPLMHPRIGAKLSCWFVSMIPLLVLAAEPVPFEEPCGPDQPTSCVRYNQTVVFAETNDIRKVCWTEWPDDVATMDLTYNVQILEFPPKDGALPVAEFTTSEGTTEWVFTPSQAGLYYLRINACDPTEGCSRWGLSLNADDTGDAYPRGFVYYFKLKAATGGGIE